MMLTLSYTGKIVGVARKMGMTSDPRTPKSFYQEASAKTQGAKISYLASFHYDEVGCYSVVYSMQI
jgi:hypothetical protein